MIKSNKQFHVLCDHSMEASSRINKPPHESTLQTFIWNKDIYMKKKMSIRPNKVVSRLVDLPPNYLPDLGTYLVSQGIGTETVAFKCVPFSIFAKLPDGTICSSVANGTPPNDRMATFDFTYKSRSKLIDMLLPRFPKFVKDLNRKQSMEIYLNLPSPIILTLTAVAGDVQFSWHDQFIPFIVVDIIKMATR